MYEVLLMFNVCVCPSSDCVFDLCAEAGREELRCGSYEAYATACQEAGVKLGAWRQKLNCGKINNQQARGGGAWPRRHKRLSQI